MNKVSANKLQLSKWTAAQPVNKEKHFIVTGLVRDDKEVVHACILEAIHSGREQILDWRELTNSDVWLRGWR